MAKLNSHLFKLRNIKISKIYNKKFQKNYSTEGNEINIDDIAKLNSDSGFNNFSLKREKGIRELLNKYIGKSDENGYIEPKYKAFLDNHGHARTPDDKELRTLAILSSLANKKRTSFTDYYKLSNEEKELVVRNTLDLNAFEAAGSRVLDKVAIPDPHTGAVTWKDVTNAKGTWEGIFYYLYVPAALLLFASALFKENKTSPQWARDQILLSNGSTKVDSIEREYNSTDLSKVHSLTPEQKREYNDRIVASILRGDYDNLNKISHE